MSDSNYLKKLKLKRSLYCKKHHSDGDKDECYGECGKLVCTQCDDFAQAYFCMKCWGCNEDKYKLKKYKNKIKFLYKKINQLKEENEQLKYQPGGLEYTMAKEHFSKFT